MNAPHILAALNSQ